MPKMTAKYSAAFSQLRKINFPTHTIDTNSQDAVYAALQERGYMWDSDQKEWICLATELADAPTIFIMVRVWADAEIVEEAADLVVKSLKRFTLAERSTPYPCRPPKQLESRVYLKFLKPEKHQ